MTVEQINKMTDKNEVLAFINQYGNEDEKKYALSKYHILLLKLMARQVLKRINKVQSVVTETPNEQNSWITDVEVTPLRECTVTETSFEVFDNGKTMVSHVTIE